MRLALAPVNPTIGNLEGNAALAGAAIARARDAGADLVVLPELCICGYPPKDLILQEGFVAACAAAAKRLGESATAGITTVIGVPLPADASRPGRGTANSLVVYRDNRYVDYHDKRLLPTYDVFDEDRYFEPGGRAVVVEVPSRVGGPVQVGLSICEDLWKGEDAGFATRYLSASDPVAEVVSKGAQLLVGPSASPFVVGKGARHRAILAAHAKRHSMPVASVNQLGGNDELVFDGHSLVYGPDGSLAAAGPIFDGSMLVVDIAAGGIGGPGAGTRSPTHVAHDSTDDQQLFAALVLGIRDYLRKTGHAKAIIGLSGGIDSALTCVLTAAAIGPGNVLGLAMPSRYSSEHSVQDAFELAKNLGVECTTIPIEPAMHGFRSLLDPAFTRHGWNTLGQTLPDLTEENLQSRLRGTTLMTVSNRTGALVVTTGNKSELGVGYCTLYGDMNGGLAALSDVSKQWVYRLSRWINANPRACGFASPPIPERSITKPPSAELRPNQTDQDSLPPYDVLDQILERYIEMHQSPERIVRETRIDPAVVARVVRLVDVAEFKRNQMAIGLKVTSVAFGSGRRYPIAQGYRPDRSIGR
ncbi:NAD+ synthase (glutamine-hydrolysing) [Phycisphaerales bacterium]|nr:NAD+ synthase (glutamine-hydrolysing) [Phycisphaerales bacterium]